MTPHEILPFGSLKFHQKERKEKRKKQKKENTKKRQLDNST